jgi:hypothetical protein
MFRSNHLGAIPTEPQNLPSPKTWGLKDTASDWKRRYFRLRKTSILVTVLIQAIPENLVTPG